MTWKFEWITDWKTIYSEPFQEKWLEWYNQANTSHVFFHPAPAMAWIETYRPIREIEPLFCIAKEGETTIFMPLICWKRNWKNGFQNIVVPLGHSDFDYHDPLIIGKNKDFEHQFYSLLINEIKKNIEFDKIELSGFRYLAGQQNWTEEPEYCPYCELDNFKNSNDFLSSLKTSLRGDVKRQQRRMEERGKITLHSYSNESLSDALAALPQFLEYHGRRWPKAFKAPGFHQRLLEVGLPLGLVDFTELRIGDIPVSWHLGFRDKGHYYYYMPVIHPEYTLFSPGKVHLLYLVEQCINDGFQLFDHLRGNENYKSGWTNQVQQLYSYTEKSEKLPACLRNWVAEKGKKLVKWW